MVVCEHQCDIISASITKKLMSELYSNSIFWVEVEKIHPNPYQPRKEFDPARLSELADSIRQYGVLQPLVVTRHEIEREDGGLSVEYELISGERRLRASKLAGLLQVPVIIRVGEDNDREKLELAIIENLQREDLNSVEKARAFKQLAEEFGFKHGEIAKKVGKSREYVSNTIRLLMLPETMLEALSGGQITDGHARPILMLVDRPEEQATLFKEVLYKKLTVRETEAIARRIAYDRVRKKERAFDPEIVELEERMSEKFGTRVQIERKDIGGRVMIDFFSNDDLRNILMLVESGEDGQAANSPHAMMHAYEHSLREGEEGKSSFDEAGEIEPGASQEEKGPEVYSTGEEENEDGSPETETGDEDGDDEVAPPAESSSDEDDLYSIKNFSL